MCVSCAVKVCIVFVILERRSDVFIFMLFELLVVLAVMYLLVNLIRYFFFKETYGGKIFGLSNGWIVQDKKEKKNE